MTHTYNITGMTCDNCLAKVKTQLLLMGDVTAADVQLGAPQATISMQKHLPVATLQQALSKAGQFLITEADGGMPGADPMAEKGWLQTYKPLLLVAAYITGVTLLVEVVNQEGNWHSWMQHFMAGFFLVFSFFKLLDLRGFADSYASYDIIAKKWFGWGYVYPFVELALGIAYLTRFSPVETSVVTFVVMSISIIGVLQSVLSKRKIQCACLGAVFQLPMSTVTVIEDALMIAMSIMMLVSTAA